MRLLLLSVPVASTTQGHDTFLRPESYDVDPRESVEVVVYNGLFDASVDSIRADAVARLERSGPAGAAPVSLDAWERGEPGSKLWRACEALEGRLGFMDERSTSRFAVVLPEEGTHIVGFQLHTARTAMTPDVFELYLAEEGLSNEPIANHGFTDPNRIIRERYTKAGKTILQAGTTLSDTPLRPLGHVAEIVPLQHPQTLRADDRLDLLILFEGRPLAGQVVIVGRQRGLWGNEPPVLLRSNDAGIVTVEVTDSGVWWVKFDHLRKAERGDEVDYVSFWATLSFEIP